MRCVAVITQCRIATERLDISAAGVFRSARPCCMCGAPVRISDVRDRQPTAPFLKVNFLISFLYIIQTGSPIQRIPRLGSFHGVKAAGREAVH
jgi:hypothetical protein